MLEQDRTYISFAGLISWKAMTVSLIYAMHEIASTYVNGASHSAHQPCNTTAIKLHTIEAVSKTLTHASLHRFLWMSFQFYFVRDFTLRNEFLNFIPSVILPESSDNNVELGLQWEAQRDSPRGDVWRLSDTHRPTRVYERSDCVIVSSGEDKFFVCGRCASFFARYKSCTDPDT